MKVAAVVVSHGPEAELGACLDRLDRQVGELVLVVNRRGSLPALPAKTSVIVNLKPRGYAANANLGVARTSTPYVVVANADAVPARDAVALLVAFAEGRPECGVAGPELRYPDGSWQPSRRRFPTPGGTLWRRSPLRYLAPPRRWQRSHYLLDERPESPVQADWLLGAFMLFRRDAFDEVGGFDEGFRMYGEDIDLCYRLAAAHWERWLVPAAVVAHTYPAVVDRRFLTTRTVWHARSMVRFVRKHPGRLVGR